MYAVLTVLNYISVFVMIICTVLVATHESSHMQKLSLLVCMMLLFCCVGFLIKSEGITRESLLVGQKLVYTTVTHGMFLMLLFILEYCKFSIPKIIEWICHFINLSISVIVLTLDHHKLFYVSTWTVSENGHTELMKEYGPVHTVAVAVFVVYMAAAVVIAVIFSVKNIKKRNRYVWRLLIAVSLPCLAYIIPKVTGTDNELQPIAFALFTVILLTMVYRSKLYDINNIAAEYSVKSVHDALIVFDSGYGYKGCNDVALTLFPFLANVGLDKDISHRSELIKEMLDGKMDEYVKDDKIYNVSLRPVENGSIMIGKVIWLEDVTMERNYTKLLQSQKHALENKVETLYDISQKDDMTGIFNRRAYEKDIAYFREKEDISNLIVAEFDINALKYTNDNLGHSAGDELIVATAEILRDIFSDYGDIYRTGGDEFFVIISKAAVDIEKIKEKLFSVVSSWRGTKAESLSLAYGFIKASDNPQMNIDELMIAVDKEMYKNKRDYYVKNGLSGRF